MTELVRKERLDNCVKELQSGDTERMELAIEELKEVGDSSILKILADIYPNCTAGIKHDIIEFISDIKDSHIVTELIDTIKICNDEDTKAALLSTIWGSKNDFSGYLDIFVQIAINGSMVEAIECYTIIDNLESINEEANILEAKTLLKENLKKVVNDEQRMVLLSEIMLKIEEFDR